MNKMDNKYHKMVKQDRFFRLKKDGSGSLELLRKHNIFPKNKGDCLYVVGKDGDWGKWQKTSKKQKENTGK